MPLIRAASASFFAANAEPVSIEGVLRSPGDLVLLGPFVTYGLPVEEDSLRRLPVLPPDMPEVFSTDDRSCGAAASSNDVSFLTALDSEVNLPVQYRR